MSQVVMIGKVEHYKEKCAKCGGTFNALLPIAEVMEDAIAHGETVSIDDEWLYEDCDFCRGTGVVDCDCFEIDHANVCEGCPDCDSCDTYQEWLEDCEREEQEDRDWRSSRDDY